MVTQQVATSPATVSHAALRLHAYGARSLSHICHGHQYRRANQYHRTWGICNPQVTLRCTDLSEIL